MSCSPVRLSEIVLCHPPPPNNLVLSSLFPQYQTKRDGGGAEQLFFGSDPKAFLRDDHHAFALKLLYLFLVESDISSAFFRKPRLFLFTAPFFYTSNAPPTPTRVRYKFEGGGDLQVHVDDVADEDAEQVAHDSEEWSRGLRAKDVFLRRRWREGSEWGSSGHDEWCWKEGFVDSMRLSVLDDVIEVEFGGEDYFSSQKNQESWCANIQFVLSVSATLGPSGQQLMQHRGAMVRGLAPVVSAYLYSAHFGWILEEWRQHCCPPPSKSLRASQEHHEQRGGRPPAGLLHDLFTTRGFSPAEVGEELFTDVSLNNFGAKIEVEKRLILGALPNRFFLPGLARFPSTDVMGVSTVKSDDVDESKEPPKNVPSLLIKMLLNYQRQLEEKNPALQSPRDLLSDKIRYVALWRRKDARARSSPSASKKSSGSAGGTSTGQQGQGFIPPEVYSKKNAWRVETQKGSWSLAEWMGRLLVAQLGMQGEQNYWGCPVFSRVQELQRASYANDPLLQQLGLNSRTFAMSLHIEKELTKQLGVGHADTAKKRAKQWQKEQDARAEDLRNEWALSALVAVLEAEGWYLFDELVGEIVGERVLAGLSVDEESERPLHKQTIVEGLVARLFPEPHPHLAPSRYIPSGGGGVSRLAKQVQWSDKRSLLATFAKRWPRLKKSLLRWTSELWDKREQERRRVTTGSTVIAGGVAVDTTTTAAGSSAVDSCGSVAEGAIVEMNVGVVEDAAVLGGANGSPALKRRRCREAAGAAGGDTDHSDHREAKTDTGKGAETVITGGKRSRDERDSNKTHQLSRPAHSQSPQRYTTVDGEDGSSSDASSRANKKQKNSR